MRPRKLILILTAALLWSACETVVEISPPPHTPQLVASGFFTADSLWLVDVERSVAYTSDEIPSPVSNAAVEILEDGRVVQVLTPAVLGARFGVYTGSGHRARPESRYTLRVSAPGFETVEGSDRLPEAPGVAAFLAERVEDEEDVKLNVEVEINDPAGETNYYGIMVVQDRLRIDVRTGEAEAMEPSLFTFESGDRVFDDDLPDVLQTGTRRHRRPLFTDELFDGTSRSIQLDIRYSSFDSDSQIQIRRLFSVVVLSLSENLYRYRTSVDRQDVADENPFAEPVRIHSNMQNGFGIFGGYRLRSFRASGEEWDAVCESWPGWTPACEARGIRTDATVHQLVPVFFAGLDYASAGAEGSH